MKKEKMSVERDRAATEQRLIDTVGVIIAESGFESVGVNAVAARSGVSKILIYRYFGSIDGLIVAYMRQNDFWVNFPMEMPEKEQVPSFLKGVFCEQITMLRNNPTLRRLYRWELSSDNEMIVKLRDQRERVGVELVKVVSGLTGYPERDIAVMASLVTASITYLIMLEEFCPVYNGIPLGEDAGWEQISDGIGVLIDKVFD